MDTKTYEQFTIPIEGEEEKRDFLKDGENYQVVFWENDAHRHQAPHQDGLHRDARRRRRSGETR